jgi:hypothetical protein
MFEVPSSANAPIAQPATRKGIWLGLGVLGLVLVIVGIIWLRTRDTQQALPLVPVVRRDESQVVSPPPDVEEPAPVFVLDKDGDGVSDEEEAKYKTDPSAPDTDGDGATDLEEIFTRKTDPLVPDARSVRPVTEPPAANPAS